MKRRNLMKTIFATCVSALVLSAGAGIATLNANAAGDGEPATNPPTVIMHEGGSIRYSDPTGIRFLAGIDDDYFTNGTLNANVTAGILMVKQSDLGEGVELNLDTPNKINSVAKASSFYATSKVDGYVDFNGVIHTIPQNHYNTSIVARAYVTTASGTEYSAAETIQVRSVAQVASIALCDGKNNETLYTFVDGALESFAVGDIQDGDTLTVNVGEKLADVTVQPSTLSVKLTDDQGAVELKNGVLTAVKAVENANVTLAVGSTKVEFTLTATLPDYYEFTAEEFLLAKGATDSYSTTDIEIYEKTGAHTFVGKSDWSCEVSAFNTYCSSTDSNAEFKNGGEVRAHLKAKGYKYIAMEFALSEGASIAVIGNAGNNVQRIAFTDGGTLTWGGNAVASRFHVYADGKELAVGTDKAEVGVWYTVVIEFDLEDTSPTNFATCGFNIGNGKPIYIAGARYYTNDSFKTDYKNA